MKHLWVLICRKPLVWRCSDWPRCTEMRFGSSGFMGWMGE